MAGKEGDLNVKAAARQRDAVPKYIDLVNNDKTV